MERNEHTFSTRLEDIIAETSVLCKDSFTLMNRTSLLLEKIEVANKNQELINSTLKEMMGVLKSKVKAP